MKRSRLIAALAASAAMCAGGAVAVLLGPYLLSWGVALAPLAFVLACLYAARSDPELSEPRLAALSVGAFALVFAGVSAVLTLEFVEELGAAENAESVLTVALESLDVSSVADARARLWPRWALMAAAAPAAFVLAAWRPAAEDRGNLPA